MKGVKVIRGSGLLFLVAVFCTVGVEASGAELQPIQVELVSSQPSFIGAESISLMPIYRVRNPNPQLVSVTIDYTLTRGGQVLGSSQMEPAYIPAGGTISLRIPCRWSTRRWWPARLPLPRDQVDGGDFTGHPSSLEGIERKGAGEAAGGFMGQDSGGGFAYGCRRFGKPPGRGRLREDLFLQRFKTAGRIEGLALEGFAGGKLEKRTRLQLSNLYLRFGDLTV